VQAPLLALAALLALAVAGCGKAGAPGAGAQRAGARAGVPQPRPQVIEPVAGATPAAPTPAPGPLPVGDPNAHAPSISEVRHLLREQLVAVRETSSAYIDPLQFVSVWERTDQGVDATMPVGAPILAPGEVKILAIIPDWYAGQPLVYFELLDGRYAGSVQYVAEEITDIARPGTILQRGQVIARFARAGTGIEYGWSTPNGTTLAVATSGYEEGQITPAGRSMRRWLNSLGASAGPSF
jgi:hypothetical protein